MATKIVTKNSSTASAAPTASDLVQGELAVNVVDKRLYTEDNAGNIVELGTNPLGEITANGGIALGDNDKATFGASDDLEIYHDTSAGHSIIRETGTGDLRLMGTNVSVLKLAGDGFLAHFIDGGASTLYHNGSAKLATTSTGIDVTGTATMDRLEVNTAGTSNAIAKLERATGNTATLTSGASTGFTIDSDDTNGGDAQTRFTQNGSLSLNIDATGDISFYEDTGTTAKMVWKASDERLGIGTSSPDTLLNIASSSAPTLRIENTDTSLSAEQVVGALEFFTRDPSGKGPNVTGYIETRAADSIGQGGTMVFATGPLGGSPEGQRAIERMRIDSSGNVLVGTTDTNPTNNSSNSTADRGIVFNGTQGWIGNATYNETTAYFNRTGTDGSIIELIKSGAVVGTIGVSSGNLTIGNGDTRLRFYDGSAKSIFTILDNGNNSDGAVDLGVSTRRFKNLYLSSGVYLGGTGAANLLDSYEEGTFTPTIMGATTTGTATYTHQKGVYTKTGNSVTVQIYLNWSGGTGSGTLRIAGLPYALYATSGYYASCAIGEYSSITGTAGHTLCGLGLPATSHIQFAENDFNSAPSTIAYEAAGYIILSMTYLT